MLNEIKIGEPVTNMVMHFINEDGDVLVGSRQLKGFYPIPTLKRGFTAQLVNKIGVFNYARLLDALDFKEEHSTRLELMQKTAKRLGLDIEVADCPTPEEETIKPLDMKYDLFMVSHHYGGGRRDLTIKRDFILPKNTVLFGDQQHTIQFLLTGGAIGQSNRDF